MKKVYFAGPLFCHAEKEYNLKLTSVLESFGYKVFLPQRDGYEFAELKGTIEEKNKKIFDLDISKIEASDIVFFVLDGRVPDEGACVELGYAYAKNKAIYGFSSDNRAFMKNISVNPMLTGCFTGLIEVKSNDSPIKTLKFYLAKHSLDPSGVKAQER